MSTQARTTTNNALLPALPAIKAYMQLWYGSSCCKASWPSRTFSLRQSQFQGFGRQPLNSPPLLNMLIARCGNGLTAYSMSGNAAFHVQQWALPFVVPNTCPGGLLAPCANHLFPAATAVPRLCTTRGVQPTGAYGPTNTHGQRSMSPAHRMSATTRIRHRGGWNLRAGHTAMPGSTVAGCGRSVVPSSEVSPPGGPSRSRQRKAPLCSARMWGSPSAPAAAGPC